MTVDGTMLSKIEGLAKKKGSQPALYDRNDKGGFDVTTWSQYWSAVQRMGRGLIALGVQPGDAVAIAGNNRPDWVICQHGINAAQAIPAPLYTTLLAGQMAFIIQNAKARVLICDEKVHLDKYLAIADGKVDKAANDLSDDDITVEHIITMDDHGVDDPRVLTMAQVMEKGDEVDEKDLEARMNAVDLDDVALLIYTSGTTGKPKGAMMSHRGIRTIGDACADVFTPIMDRDHRLVSYLPLCHAAEQGITNFAGLVIGGETYFCRDLKQIKDFLTEAHPTIFLAVPRVWEKFEAALRGKMAETKGLKGKLAAWALKTELEAFKEELRSGRPVSSLSRTWANKLVISKIKEKLGLDSLAVALSGAAPISTSTLEFFASLGLVIHEGYGMTETTAFASIQPYGRPKFGTIGRPLLGVEARIAEDGEIMLRGDNMVKGYYRLDEKTAELYDDEGWMHTGDLGAIDEDGYISITGRKKDLIITAGGKNVAPAEMEGHLQGIPGVGQAVVVGDRQPYLCSLIVLDPEALPELEAASGVSGLKDVETAAKNPDVKKFLEEQTEKVCNSRVARYQTIKKISVLPVVFSVDGGELTPTLKVKRNVVNEKYADAIDAFYKGTKDKAAEKRA